MMRSTAFRTRRETTTDYIYGPFEAIKGELRTRFAGTPVVAVVDEEVAAHHGERVDGLLSGADVLGVVCMRGGEQCKTFGQLQALLGELEDLELPKHGTVVAIGGGTVCDVSGLAAMLINRSVGLTLVPTTLLAQVDAAVGGKNGINTDRRKNLIGHFHHAEVVAGDQAFLTTLPRRHVVSGVAECIKVFAVAGAEVLDAHTPTLLGLDLVTDGLEPWSAAIWDAARLKLELLEEDPFERSSRRLLNYGHAFAHSFEERSTYRLLHGEAVLLGMMIENEVSRELGIGGGGIDALQNLIVGLLTPACAEHWVAFDEMRPELDKLRQLRRGAMNLVCLVRPGEATIVDDADDAVLAAAWARAASQIEGATTSAGAAWDGDAVVGNLP